MMRQGVERAIRTVRADPTYSLDPGISTRDVIAEAFVRGRSLFRAQWKLAGVAGGRMRFVESRCAIRHRRCLSVGTGTVIEHGARLSCLSRDGMEIGQHVTIGKYALIECTGVLWHLGSGLKVGDRSSVGDYSFLGCSGGIVIGRDVLMGQRVSMHSQNHGYADLSRPIREQGVIDARITVGDNCWLGSGSILLAGVELGHGCVVAAGSVVRGSFAPNSVIAGVPARLIRERGIEEKPHGLAPDLSSDGPTGAVE